MRVAVIPNEKEEAMALQQPVCRALEQAGVTPVAINGLPGADQLQQAVAGCDAAVAIGGDGTIVHVAKALAAKGCPVLGINAGYLGFLAGLEGNELTALPALWQQQYAVEERALLTVQVYHAGEAAPATYLAMNEAVLSRGALSQLVELQVTDGGRELLSCRGDGVIVATPTGSTAYSLSAGGPVIDPAVDCLLVTPICPHSITSRAQVLPGTAVLEIRGRVRGGGQAFLTVDGEENIAIGPEDRVLIGKAPIAARLIRLKNTTVADVLSEKMLGRRTL